MAQREQERMRMQGTLTTPPREVSLTRAVLHSLGRKHSSPCILQPIISRFSLPLLADICMNSDIPGAPRCEQAGLVCILASIYKEAAFLAHLSSFRRRHPCTRAVNSDFLEAHPGFWESSLCGPQNVKCQVSSNGGRNVIFRIS